MQEIAKEELMSTLDPTSTTAHGAECSLCHAARQCPLGGWHGKMTRWGQPPQLALQPKEGQKLT